MRTPSGFVVLALFVMVGAASPGYADAEDGAVNFTPAVPSDSSDDALDGDPMTPQSICNGHIWEEDCRDCCDMQSRLTPVIFGALCGGGAGMLCGAGGPVALICGATAYTLCVAPMLAINQDCFRSCDPLPQKPGEGAPCGRLGHCSDSCERPAVPVPGVCGDHFVCCGLVDGVH